MEPSSWRNFSPPRGFLSPSRPLTPLSPRILARAVAAATAAAALAPAAAHAETVPGEVVVSYRAPAHATAARVAAAHAPQVLRHVGDVPATLRRLRSRPDVRYAVPNVVARAAQAFVPDDPG